jgi:uncharacterized secreted repeat protein (TIGR03808 family)
MNTDRRRLLAALAGAAAGAAATPAHATEPSMPRGGIDAATFGVRPNSAEDQSKALQRAIDSAAAARAVLQLSPGTYRAGSLQLPPYAAISGTPGATRIVMLGGPSLLSAATSDHVTISGLVLDGGGLPLPERRGLIHLAQGRAVRITDCEIVNAGRNGMTLEAIEGDVTGNLIGAGDVAIFSLDARGLRIAGNTVRGASNGGILVWRSASGDDGTLVVDNRIEDVAAKAGGSGQYDNAVNVFRAGNVIVRGNRIRNAAFSAVRGNTASNLQIVGNTCTGLGEVALYAEFGFEGALIANNIVDGAALGVSVTNFNQGGRLAVVQGNVIRNLTNKRPPGTDPKDLAGVGIGIEADTVVTGKVVENAPNIGIGRLSARRCRQRQCDPQRRFRHHRIGRPGRRRGGDRRQPHLRRPPRRHRRHGMEQTGHRRSRQGRRHPLRAIVDRGQQGAVSDDRRLTERGESPRAASPPASGRAFASASSGLCERLGHS